MGGAAAESSTSGGARVERDGGGGESVEESSGEDESRNPRSRESDEDAQLRRQGERVAVGGVRGEADPTAVTEVVVAVGGADGGVD